MKKRFYHTSTTDPPEVRKSVRRGWEAMWRRLRRFPERDRSLELRSGTRLTVDGVDFKVKYSDRERLFYIQLAGEAWDEKSSVVGSSAFGYGKPYTYTDDLQAVLDTLIVKGVLTS